jgi:hypothetical protein
MKARCINDSGWGKNHLTEGKIYEVTEDNFNTFNFASDEDPTGKYIVSCYRTRFIVLDSDQETTQSSNKLEKPINLDEECPCQIGITRGQCPYHH